MKRALVILVVAACQASSGGGDDYQIGPGGKSPLIPGDPTGDGGVDGGDAGVLISRRVCLLTDLRDIGKAASCSGTLAGGLTVLLDGKTATTKTAMNGAFQIEAPVSSTSTWRVSRDDTTSGVPLMITLTPYSSELLIPAITSDRYDDLKGGSGITFGTDTGSMIVLVRQGTPAVPAQNITAVGPADQTQDVQYDDANSAENWNTVSTGPAGLVWVPAVPVAAGSARLTTVVLQRAGATVGSVTATVADQSITFVTQGVPAPL